MIWNLVTKTSKSPKVSFIFQDFEKKINIVKKVKKISMDSEKSMDSLKKLKEKAPYKQKGYY